jgi:hypothetical protein
MKKILAIDAIGLLVDVNGKINFKINRLINEFDNKKIVLTNANDNEKKKFLKNVNYKIFSLKHNPEKSNITYFKKFLLKYNLKPNQLIYIEHNIKACRSARKNKIKTFHYVGNYIKLKKFLKLNLN